MGYDILRPEQIFLYACVLGVLLGILYDVCRIFRLAINWNIWQIFLQDILYFVVCGILTFIFLLTFNNGVIRIYVLFGECLGWGAYYITFGKLIYRCSSRIINYVKKILKKVFSVILNPIFKIFKKVKCKIYNKKIKNNKM